VSGLSRSKIAAKQLAHNAISGFDDDSTLREIVKMIDDVDDMIESFVGKEIMEEPLEQYDKMLSPAVQFDFKNVTFTFLPHQVKDMDALVKDLESKAPDIVGVASYEQCKGFVETLSKYQKFTDIRNVGAAIHSMIENAAQKMDDCGFTEEGEWTYLAKLFGSNAVPGESASVIQQAIKKAEKEGTITSKNRWQLIEYLCAEVPQWQVVNVWQLSQNTMPLTTITGRGLWLQWVPPMKRSPLPWESPNEPLCDGPRNTNHSARRLEKVKAYQMRR